MGGADEEGRRLGGEGEGGVMIEDMWKGGTDQAYVRMTTTGISLHPSPPFRTGSPAPGTQHRITLTQQ